MKRVAMTCAILSIASFTFAQASGTAPTQNQPSGQQQPAPAQQGGQAAPPLKHPPQAKTQPEYDGFQAASGNADPAALEKAADDFSAKFPDSELRILLYRKAMELYRGANNADKSMEMSRKVLAIDADDPQALVNAAMMIAERTRDTDLDKDQRYQEASKDAQRALQTVDTDVPAAVPADKVDLYKGYVRSDAYSVLGTIEFNKSNFAGAETNYRKSIDAFPQQPDPVTILRLAIALDRENKYPEALTFAEKAVGMTSQGGSLRTSAERERDRLLQLTGGKPAGSTTTAAPQTTPQTTTPPPKP